MYFHTLMLDFRFEWVLLSEFRKNTSFAPGICQIAREIMSLWCRNQAVNTNPTNIGICGLLVSCTFIIWCWISGLNECYCRNLEKTQVLLQGFARSLGKFCLCNAEIKCSTPTLLILVSMDSLYDVTFIIWCWSSCLNQCCRRNLENTQVLLLVFVKSLWKLCLCDAQVKLFTPTLLILVSIDSLYRILS